MLAALGGCRLSQTAQGIVVQGMLSMVSCRALLLNAIIPACQEMALLMAHLRSSTTSRIRAEVSCAVSDTMR